MQTSSTGTNTTHTPPYGIPGSNTLQRNREEENVGKHRLSAECKSQPTLHVTGKKIQIATTLILRIVRDVALWIHTPTRVGQEICQAKTNDNITHTSKNLTRRSLYRHGTTNHT